MRLLIAGSWLLGVLLLASCGGGSAPACGASTCSGCCTTSGRCEVPSASSCGVGGNACTSCSGAESCSSQGACVSTAAACSSATCPNGCCDGNSCIAAAQDNACGSGGGSCTNCTGLSVQQYCDTMTRRCRLHRVFVSSLSYEGDLKAAVPGASSGLDAADKLCSQLGAGAALSGTFKAYLASGTTTAWSRIANKGPWAQKQDAATYIEGFKAAGGSPVSPIIRDENENNIGATEIWTGAHSAGSVGETCLEWTSKTTSSYATIGSMAYASTWTDSGNAGSCYQKRRLLCFEQ